MFAALASLLLLSFLASPADAYVPSIAATAGFGNNNDAAASTPGGLIVIEFLAGAVVFLFIFTPHTMLGPLFTRARHMSHTDQIALSAAMPGIFGPTMQMVLGGIRMIAQFAGVAIFTGYVLHCFPLIADTTCFEWTDDIMLTWFSVIVIMIGATLRAEILAFECFYGLWSSVGRYVGAALAIASAASWAVISTFLIIEIVNLDPTINTIWEDLTLAVAIAWFLVDVFYAIFFVWASVVFTPGNSGRQPMLTPEEQAVGRENIMSGKRFV